MTPAQQSQTKHLVKFNRQIILQNRKVIIYIIIKIVSQIKHKIIVNKNVSHNFLKIAKRSLFMTNNLEMVLDNVDFQI